MNRKRKRTRTSRQARERRNGGPERGWKWGERGTYLPPNNSVSGKSLAILEILYLNSLIFSSYFLIASGNFSPSSLPEKESKKTSKYMSISEVIWTNNDELCHRKIGAGFLYSWTRIKNRKWKGKCTLFSARHKAIQSQMLLAHTVRQTHTQ